MKRTATTCWQIHGAGIAACAALSALFWFVLVAPALGKHHHQSAMVEQLAARQLEAQRSRADLEASQHELSSMNEAVSQGRLTLQPASTVNARIAKLADLAGACGVTLDEVRPAPPADAAHFQTVAIRVAGTGSFPACAAFLHQLHAAFPDIGVQSFNADNPTPGPASPKLALKLELVWYAKKG
ncbi:MAG TPA: GspMb/PilO family protein [Tepidisphaeraceae bacterium]|nr:GspMb/PilO family protein [Tepidisphaeraceae bacterium]